MMLVFAVMSLKQLEHGYEKAGDFYFFANFDIKQKKRYQIQISRILVPFCVKSPTKKNHQH